MVYKLFAFALGVVPNLKSWEDEAPLQSFFGAEISGTSRIGYLNVHIPELRLLRKAS